MILFIVIITIIILFIIKNYKYKETMSDKLIDTYYVQPILIDPINKDTMNITRPCNQWQKCLSSCSLMDPNKVYPGNMFTGLNSLKTLFPCGKCKCLFNINQTSG